MQWKSAPLVYADSFAYPVLSVAAGHALYLLLWVPLKVRSTNGVGQTQCGKAVTSWSENNLSIYSSP